MTLVAYCMNRAKHRRRKAAAKLHLRLDLQSFLPLFGPASRCGPSPGGLCCAHDGEILEFDKAYGDFGHLADLGTRGVVLGHTPHKDNLNVPCIKRGLKKAKGPILRYDEVLLVGFRSR